MGNRGMGNREHVEDRGTGEIGTFENVWGDREDGK